MCKHEKQTDEIHQHKQSPGLLCKINTHYACTMSYKGQRDINISRYTHITKIQTCIGILCAILSNNALKMSFLTSRNQELQRSQHLL